MCGICGIVYDDRRRPVEASVLERMSAVLRHRGPDGRGRVARPGVGLAVRRLSLVDPAGGRQPIENETGTITLVCNGEIYNHPELRRDLESRGHRFRTDSDVEVVAHLYEEDGPDCVHRLRGMFAFALWDDENGRLMLARDRLGIKPLSYAEGPGWLAFGSESKAILAGGLVEPRLDPVALDAIFAIGFVRTPRTMFREIRRLPPGSMLLREDGVTRRVCWWEPPVPGSDPLPGTFAQWAEELRARIEDSVRIHLRGDEVPGAWLSAGIDSSAIVALMESRLDGPPRTYSLSFDGGGLGGVEGRRLLGEFPGHRLEGRVVRESKEMSLLAEAIWFTEEPNTINFGASGLALSRACAEDGVKTVLTGEGADEVFAGYHWYRIEAFAAGAARLPDRVRKAIWGDARSLWRGKLNQHLRAPRSPGLARYASIIGPLGAGRELFSGTLRESLDGHDPVGEAAPEGLDRRHPIERLQYWETRTRLPDFVIHVLDRFSMANSVEARVPFLDHPLVEWAARLPVAAKTRPWVEKRILREALRGILPEEIRTRRKDPLLAPYRRWFRESPPPFVAEMLSEERVREKGWFDPGAVGEALRVHRAREADRYEALLGVLGVQVWDEIFLRGASPGDLAIEPVAAGTAS